MSAAVQGQTFTCFAGSSSEGTCGIRNLPNLSTLLSSSTISVCFVNPCTRKNPTIGNNTSLANASDTIEANGQREIGLGMLILANAEPSTINPSGTLALPKNAAVSSKIASGGCPSGAVGWKELVGTYTNSCGGAWQTPSFSRCIRI